MRLADRIAVVTGGASGIGLASVQRMLEEGATVTIADIDPKAGDRAVADLKTRGLSQVESVPTDVSKSDDVRRLVDGVVARHGRIDVLFNNAGFFEPGQVHEVGEADWERAIAVNLRSVYLCSHDVVPLMLDPRQGRDRQQRLSSRARRRHRRGGVLRDQGSRRPVDEGDGSRLCVARHPRQRDLLRGDRHAALRARGRPARHVGRGVSRRAQRSAPDRSHRPPWGGRRRSRFSRQRRRKLHHGRAAAGRWRVFRDVSGRCRGVVRGSPATE